MRKYLIFTGIAVAILILLAWGILTYVKVQVKSKSPDDLVSFGDGTLKIELFYNRPFKKDREIFGKLVPYNKVWRTGANEATTFETNKALSFDGNTLPAGKYSLWTIPGPELWTIIFNKETGQWGIDYNGEANRKPELDVLHVEVSPVTQERVFEQFTILFEKKSPDYEMVLVWDKTLVPVDFQVR